MKPKVLIGIPTSFHKEYCLNEFLEGIKNLDYPNFDHLIIENSSNDNYFNKLKKLNLNVIKGKISESPIQSISMSRNQLIDVAIEKKYDYLLFLDQDVILPKDSLTKLTSHNKKAICGIYFNNIVQPNGTVKLSSGVYKVIPNSENEEGLPSMEEISEQELFGENILEVVSCGGGCLIIHKDILEKVRFNEELERFEDRHFCIDLFKKNIKLSCDPRVKCKHMIVNRPYKWKEGKLIKNQ